MGGPSNKPSDGSFAYSLSDDDLFRRLSDFSSVSRPFGEAEAPLAGPRSFADPSEACRYTDADTSAFDELTRALDLVRPIRGAVRSAALSKRAGCQYSPDDQRHFDALMSDERWRKAFHSGRPPAVTDSERLPETVRYAERDLSAFEKLLADLAMAPARMEPAPKGSQPGRDRDVGRIRIVDADAEREKVQRSALHKSKTLKIKYFD